ncbi:multicopper oxidase family protein [Vibrio sp. S4M6]|uniref:multicopper oxidase family protein n=1 Tax=Vibrio sinus TaxID=2946865 RepID=UPI00202A94E6|nr:multicopper oxidase family protein [Vibrio sinus]MCL9781744.1 multicopper oxidase family protein [Vibrio sinus]
MMTKSKTFKMLATAGLAILPLYSVSSYAAQAPITLTVHNTQLNIDGHNETVYQITNSAGGNGFTGREGENFNAIVKNDTDKPITLHWHGLVDPNKEDGVPDVTQLPIPPHGQQHYDFKLNQTGTYWMHSHVGFEEARLMAAPFIIYPKSGPEANVKNVTMMVQDFNYASPNSIWKALTKPNESKLKINGNEINDVPPNVLLANRHTLKKPEIVRVKVGEKVRLRFINGSTDTNVYLNMGKLDNTLIAVDGQGVKPVNGNNYQVAIAQRSDVLFTVPHKGAFPIIAEGEGTKLRTGIILATEGAKIPNISEKVNTEYPAYNYKQLLQLHAKTPLAKRKVDEHYTLNLTGDMTKYAWEINGKTWPNTPPLWVSKGERVEVTLNNESMMPHPMHLHGTDFQIVSLNGKAIDGPMRDTVNVLPHSKVTIAFDADNPGVWAFHCHILWHADAGMMTTVRYRDYPAPQYYLNLTHQPATAPKA